MENWKNNEVQLPSDGGIWYTNEYMKSNLTVAGLYRQKVGAGKNDFWADKTL